MATLDPRRIADSKDAWVTALYAKTAGSTANDGVLPLVIDANGYLCINMTVGTVSLSTTGVTITNAVGNPANVSLTNTKVTIESTGLNVTLTATAVTASLANSGVTISIARTITGSTGSTTLTFTTLYTPTNKAKIVAFSLTTTSASEVLVVIGDGTVANFREKWRCTLMAPAGANSGANLAASAPGYLFETRTASAVTISLSTAVLVHYSISLFDEV